MPSEGASETGKKRRTEELIGLVISLAAAVITAILVFGTFVSVSYRRGVTPLPTTERIVQVMEMQTAIIKGLKADIDSLKAEDQKIRSEITSMARIPTQVTQVGLAIRIARAEGIANSVEARMATLEKVILTNPAKALETNLLRRDLEAVRESRQADLLSIKQEMDRIFDLNKWFIGLMFTMAIGLLGLVASNFVRFRAAKEKE